MSIRWKLTQLNKNGVYYDPCSSPLYPGHNSLGDFRRDILSFVPVSETSKGDKRLFNRVLVPFACDADPFWSLGCPEGFLNHSYTPIGAMLFALKTDPNFVFDTVAGRTITEEDFETIRQDFNTHFGKLRDMRGKGPRGTATIDEFTRLGVLFMMLNAASDKTFGLMTNYCGDFENPWCGRKSFTYKMKWKDIQIYSAKLKEVQFSDMPWNNFFWRHISKTGSDDFWFLNLPDLDPSIYNKSHEANREDILNFMTNNVPLLSRRGARILLFVKLTKERFDEVSSRLDLKDMGSHYEGTGLRVSSFEQGVGFRPISCVITNYRGRSTGFQVIEPSYTDLSEFNWRDEEVE